MESRDSILPGALSPRLIHFLNLASGKPNAAYWFDLNLLTRIVLRDPTSGHIENTHLRRERQVSGSQRRYITRRENKNMGQTAARKI